MIKYKGMYLLSRIFNSSSSIFSFIYNCTYRQTTASQRNWRFNSESNLTHFPIYTRQLCLQECRLELTYQKCDCIPHFYPNQSNLFNSINIMHYWHAFPFSPNEIVPKPKPVCPWYILRDCVAPLRQKLAELSTVHCGCMQNCVDSDVIINAHKVMYDQNELLGTNGGILTMKDYPVVRYKRKILFSFTDLLGSLQI